MRSDMKSMSIILGAACLFGAANFATHAQEAAKKGECADQTATTTTEIEKGPDSGTKNMGTTGWNGGMREPGSGSPSDKVPGQAATEQPTTAQGLDPTKPETRKSSAC